MSSAVEAQTRVFDPDRVFLCRACSFELWTPIAALSVSGVGLYDDVRFPGRLLVSLEPHYDHIDDVPVDLLNAFMADIRVASQALRDVVGADRVNLAVLGNAESHVHAHLIPRTASSEPQPSRSPWQDPRPLQPLGSALRAQVLVGLTDRLTPSECGPLRHGAWSGDTVALSGPRPGQNTSTPSHKDQSFK